MKSIEITASSYDEAVAQALEQLQLTIDQVEIGEVKESGLIRKKVSVTVTQKNTTDIIAKDFIQGIIDRIGLLCEAEVTEQEESFNVLLSGPDTATLIGYRGDVLDSLQYLTLLVANKSNPGGKRIIIDGENYREKRSLTLSKLAKKLAFKAAKSNESISLEPMNPFERRIIHSALHDDKFVTTKSEGEEPNRYVVIVPNKRERRPYGDRPNRNNDRTPRPNRSYDSPRPQESQPSQPSQEDKDMYNQEVSRNFKRTGASKMKSFGGPKTKYF